MKHASLAAMAADSPSLPEVPSEAEVSPFERLAAPLREALEQRGFSDLTVVQKAVLDAAIDGRDLQVSSQTGSGKTLALGLVISPSLLEAAKAGPPRALVVAPTRELATQVKGELEWLFAGVPGVTVDSMTGGTSVYQEKRRLSSKPAIVVGTPGRLLDHIRSGALDCSAVRELVLDEADRMLDMGFREELEAILEATPSERRTHLVSATFPPEIKKLARKYQKEPLSVEGTRLGAANEDIEHVGHLLRLHDRYAAMVNLLLLGGDERTLIFVNTRAQAGELSAQLAADGFAAAPISGELEQNQRTRTLEAFRGGTTSILVATDVAARGLDIPDVSLVIHTDAPMDAESYTHRAGRTGRAGRKGKSVLLVTPMRQKKVEMLLSRANVKLVWRDVPTADAVEKQLAKRERRRLREALASGPAPAEGNVAFAQTLLEEGDAADLVARLIERCRDPRRTDAREVETLQPQSARRDATRMDRPQWKNRPDPRQRGDAGGDARPMRGGPGRFERDGDASERRTPRRDGDGFEPRSRFGRDGQREPRRFDRDEQGPPPRLLRAEEAMARRRHYDGSDDDRRPSRTTAERFEMNWGQRGGATPQRVLAVLCRRGEVSSRAIGAIDIDTFTTTFEVAREVARDFEHNASQPDDRDPRLMIRRARDRRR